MVIEFLDPEHGRMHRNQTSICLKNMDLQNKFGGHFMSGK